MIYDVSFDLISESIKMEKFILRGTSSSTEKAAVFHLRLPPAKKFDYLAVKNGEEVLNTNALLAEALNRKKTRSSHAKPSAMVDGKSCFLPRTLQQLLSSHPFPVSQGPVVLSLDTNTAPKRHSGIVLGEKAHFTHDHKQTCALWRPEVTGIAAWTDEGSTYSVSDVDDRIQGAASKRSMELVYTCHMWRWSGGCVIHCPCSICMETGAHCRDRHWSEPCLDCNSQCTKHQMKLLRLFDLETDHFTIVTEDVSRYRYAHGYAGIPKSCESCSKDILEHQVLHLVWHDLCRFCRYEMRPVSRNVITVRDYEKEAVALVKRNDRTCSVCLDMSFDKLSREKHELVVHFKETQKFKCDQCEKTYTNKNALNYHVIRHSEDFVKPTCEVCGSQFSCTDSLVRHKQNIHKDTSNVPSFECDDCGNMFSMESALKRHVKEQHYGPNFNNDYHEGYKILANFQCSECDMEFKRNSHLNRHIRTAHSVNNFQCTLCDKSYKRKDALNRHVKSNHG